jgi:hypothetical protein
MHVLEVLLCSAGHILLLLTDLLPVLIRYTQQGCRTLRLHKCSCKEYEEKKQLKHRAADFCWMCSGQLALAVIMLLQTDEAYCYLGLTGV